MQVFRVLHVNDGIGPYSLRCCEGGDCQWTCSGCMLNEVGNDLMSAYWGNRDGISRWPVPVDDGMRVPFYTTKDQVFGFASLDALFDWFGEWLPSLEAVGFIVAEYEAEVIKDHRGNSGQVMFDISEAEFIDVW